MAMISYSCRIKADEMQKFVSFYNSMLKDNEVLRENKYYPLTIENIFTKLRDGVVLCHIIHQHLDPTIELEKLIYKKNNALQRSSNLQILLQSASRCKINMVNVNATTLASGSDHLVFSFSWRIIREDIKAIIAFGGVNEEKLWAKVQELEALQPRIEQQLIEQQKEDDTEGLQPVLSAEFQEDSVIEGSELLFAVEYGLDADMIVLQNPSEVDVQVVDSEKQIQSDNKILPETNQDPKNQDSIDEQANFQVQVKEIANNQSETEKTLETKEREFSFEQEVLEQQKTSAILQEQPSGNELDKPKPKRILNIQPIKGRIKNVDYAVLRTPTREGQHQNTMLVRRFTDGGQV